MAPSKFKFLRSSVVDMGHYIHDAAPFNWNSLTKGIKLRVLDSGSGPGRLNHTSALSISIRNVIEDPHYHSTSIVFQNLAVMVSQ